MKPIGGRVLRSPGIHYVRNKFSKSTLHSSRGLMNTHNSLFCSTKYQDKRSKSLHVPFRQAFIFQMRSFQTLKDNDLEHSVDNEMKILSSHIKELIDDGIHPLLREMASYYPNLDGKRIRPRIILLLAHALEEHLNRKGLIAGYPLTKSVSSSSTVESKIHYNIPKASQLGAIVEMIHLASLIHDDVIDEASTRRGSPSINLKFQSNKLSVFAGIFLLSQASVSLAHFRNHEVTEVISGAISNLVKGEILQTKTLSGEKLEESLQIYTQKTFYKTASLITSGCRAVALLLEPVESLPNLVEMASEYGRNLGLAFQIVDDLLDFTQSAETLGKPAAMDLSLGLATAPVLFASQEFPELNAMMARKFREPGDVETARKLVLKSNGLAKTRDLAAGYVNKAIEDLVILENSPAKESLIQLAHIVLSRNK